MNLRYRPTSARKLRRRAFTLVELLVVIAIIGILVALLLPAIQAAREAARRMACQSNLHNLAIAVANYENAKKALPPAALSVPNNGELLSITDFEKRASWIVHVLPYMEQQDLFDQFDVVKRFLEANVNLQRPEESQPESLLCPSDGASGRVYSSTFTQSAPPIGQRRFAKGNYAAYVSPEHVITMRVFPGALINETQPMGAITDGTSKTIMLSEVRTRADEKDPRGAWAAAWVGGSILAVDMHAKSFPQAADNSGNPKRNSPYSPFIYASPKTEGLTPNCGAGHTNEDYIRECPDKPSADTEGMPCFSSSGTGTSQTSTRQAAAPRSQHPGGVNAANVDGSVIYVIDNVEQHLFARRVSINDAQGELEGEQP